MADYETLKNLAGFEEPEIKRFDSYYYDLCNAINQNNDIYSSINNLKKNKNNKIKTYKDIKDNIKIFDALGLKLRDVNVTDIDSYDIFGESTCDYDDVTTSKHPSDIPLFLVDTNMLYDKFNPSYSEMETTTVKSLTGDGREISYIAMGLDKNSPYTAGSYYNHEIVHTQIDSLKGSYKDYFNRDVIPIFIELLTANYNNNEGIVNLIRLYELSESFIDVCYHTNISREEEIEGRKNVYSTLKALKLYTIYLQSSEQEKKNIINHIQRIFNGDLTVEAMMDKYELDEESSRIVIKTLQR